MSYLGKRIDSEVSNHVRTWAKRIKLTSLDPQFSQFRADVANALHTCIVFHIAEQDPKQLEEPARTLARAFRVLKKFPRTADTRRRLEKDATEARDLAQRLRDKQANLAQRLRDFSNRYKGPTLVIARRGRPGRGLDPTAPTAEGLEELASLFDEAAAACKDTGGPTRTMKAFDALAEGLILAYRRATERMGTGGNVRDSGRPSLLRALVVDVQLIAYDLAIAVTGKPLEVPATEFLGDRLVELGKRLDQFEKHLAEIALRSAQPPKIDQ